MLLVVLIVFQVIIFAFLVFLLKKVLSKNITSATQHLDVLTRDYMKKQEEVDKRLDEINQMYQKKISEAKEEAEKIKQAIQQSANAQKEKIIEKARQESEEMIKQAEKARQNLILEMERKIKEKAIEEAVSLLDKALSQEVRLILHNHLVDEFIHAGIDKLSISQNVDASFAVIKSAFDLDDSKFDVISSKLKEKIGKNIEFIKEKDVSLLSGLLINIGSLVIDASLKWKIKEGARQLINEV